MYTHRIMLKKRGKIDKQAKIGVPTPKDNHNLSKVPTMLVQSDMKS